METTSFAAFVRLSLAVAAVVRTLARVHQSSRSVVVELDVDRAISQNDVALDSLYRGDCCIDFHLKVQQSYQRRLDRTRFEAGHVVLRTHRSTHGHGFELWRCVGKSMLSVTEFVKRVKLFGQTLLLRHVKLRIVKIAGPRLRGQYAFYQEEHC